MNPAHDDPISVAEMAGNIGETVAQHQPHHGTIASVVAGDNHNGNRVGFSNGSFSAGSQSPIHSLSPLIEHQQEPEGNRWRAVLHQGEPRSLRTYTPTQAVITRASGVWMWTADNRPLYDFTSGVLVANLGHYPASWTARWFAAMGWPPSQGADKGGPFQQAVPLTTYNAMTHVEAEAVRRLVGLLRSRPGGQRIEQVLWAASGSEAIQKALWAAMAFQKDRPMIVATRYGFHGKKGLAAAVTGCETDPERDPRVRFISFPMDECRDVSLRGHAFDPTPYQRELEQLWHQFGRRIGTLITEPYLGGGGSYHPPKAYLQLLQRFCRDNDILFILDEVQSNFGRTGSLFAYETYGLEPDIVVLGKGLGNGVPVAAAVGRADVFAALNYGEASDTYSAHPMGCAAVLATVEEYQRVDWLQPMRMVSARIEAGLTQLLQYPFVAHIRGEKDGMVWGVEMRDYAGRSANEWANSWVLEAYRGGGPMRVGVHLLGPLAKKVVRIAPPLVISAAQADEALAILHEAAQRLSHRIGS
jgi:4-aminobutyrate aminotransferase-like enzyme